MHVQVNIHQIEGNARLQNWVSTTLGDRLQRYADLLTRIEVHISDQNAHKSGPDDKRCQIEARLKGQPAISVSHKAQDLELAVDGATEKLRHALEHLLGKLEAKSTANGRPQAPRETASDALLQEEFLARQEALKQA